MGDPLAKFDPITAAATSCWVLAQQGAGVEEFRAVLNTLERQLLASVLFWKAEAARHQAARHEDVKELERRLDRLNQQNQGVPSNVNGS